MRHVMKAALAVVAIFILCAGWTALAQVQEKPRVKPPATNKPAPATPKAAAAAAKQPAATTAKDTAKPIVVDTSKAEPESADETAIRKGAEAFVTAYNAHDAKAVSELFALRAEFTDEDGKLIKGRDAIEKDFAEKFAEDPECRIEVEVDSVRILTPNIAIEEGIVRGEPAPGEAKNVSSYAAVHVKVEGRWVIASVSDFEAEPDDLSARDNLEELAWMVGDWIDESPDSVVKTSCRWDASGNYLLHEFVLEIAGEISANGSMRIGSDPLTGQLKSWTFNADSGYSEGLWTRTGDEWSVKARGVNSDGEVTLSTNVFRYVDQDTMTWRSYDRVIGSEPADDITEYIIKRQAPAPEEF